MIGSRPLAILVGLLVAAVALVAAELVVGATHGSVKIANPCARRTPFPGHGVDATIQRVVLDGLDGAACRLHTSREQLVLSLDGKGRWDRHTIEVTVRAGLERAVDDAGRRGDIPGFLVPLVRRVVEHAPLAALLKGAISLAGLTG
jgi:hypothetical protein